jgi:hypothetical protein
VRRRKKEGKKKKEMVYVCGHVVWAGVALGKGEVGDRPRPHLKIRPSSQKFLSSLLKGFNVFIYTKIKEAYIFKTSL